MSTTAQRILWPLALILYPASSKLPIPLGLLSLVHYHCLLTKSAGTRGDALACSSP